MLTVHKVIVRAMKPSNHGRLSRKAVEMLPTLLDTKYGLGNCWGTTLYTLGVREEPTFVDGCEMHEWLAANTRKVRKPAFGDVLVIRCESLQDAVENGNPDPYGNGRLRHTCVYVGDGLYWHQAGYGGPYALETLEEVRETYRGGVCYHVRRV